MTGPGPRHPDLGYEAIPEAAIEVPMEPPLRRLRRALRGRYRVLVPLSFLLALAGGIAGYRAKTPQYRSTGLALVEGTLSPILYESQETRVPPMFEAHVAAQAAFLQSRRVLEAALDRPTMREAGWPSGLAGVAELQRSLSISRGRREHMLTVAITHPDPARAQAAVDAVLDAFRALAPGPPGLSVSAKERTLIERENELVEQIASLRGQILELSDHYDYEGVARRHATRVEEMMLVDRKLEEIRAVRARLDDPAADAEPAGAIASLLAVPEETLRRLDDRERALVAEIESLRGTYGPKHPTMRDLRRKLAAISIEKALLEGRTDKASVDPEGTPLLSPEHDDTARRRLARIEAQYVALRTRIREDVERLGAQRVTLAGLDERSGTAAMQLAETRRRLDELRVEARRQNANRITISAWGDYPVAPISDRRRSFAAAGALFGGGIGFALVLLAGLVDPRLRYADELERLVEIPPIIGLVPRLAGGSARQRAMAARIVHQIRSLLELQRETPAGIVHAVTSADRREGRTSLALALARSFAAAGSRTLLVDADGTDAGLSRELGLTGRPGLLEAARSPEEADAIYPSGQEMLWAMPSGATVGPGGEDLSRSRLERVIHEVRTRFDVVLLDTGPLLTGVQAGLAAAVADDVILVVERYRRLDRVRAALERLARAGARCRGVIFNRAPESDLDHHRLDRRRPGGGVLPLVPAPASSAPDAPDVIPLHAQRTADQDHQERRRAA